MRRRWTRAIGRSETHPAATFIVIRASEGAKPMGIPVLSGSALRMRSRRDGESSDQQLEVGSLPQRNRRSFCKVIRTSGDDVGRGYKVWSRISMATDTRIRRGLEHLGNALVARCSRELGKESSTRPIVKIMRFVPPGSLGPPAFAPPFSCAKRSTLMAGSVSRVA